MVNFMLHVFYQEEKYENKQSKNEKKKKPKRYLNCVLFPTLNYLKLAKYIPSHHESGH